MRRRRWGLCKHCQAPAFHRCRRCEGWVCTNGTGAHCAKLRKVVGEIGRYDLVCSPRCRKTRSDFGQLRRDVEQLAELYEISLAPRPRR